MLPPDSSLSPFFPKSTGNKYLDFILDPQLNQLLYEHYIQRKMETMDPLERETLKLERTDLDRFILYTSCFPGYFRYIRKQVRAVPKYKTHIKTLSYLLILDILYGEKATLRKTKEKPSEDDKGVIIGYNRETERTRRRFFRYYPALLYRPSKDTFQELENKTHTPYTSIFTAPSFEDIHPSFLDTIPVKLSREEIISGEYRVIMQPKHSEYRMVEPFDLEEIIEFHEIVSKILDEIIRDNGPVETENQWILDHLQAGAVELDSLYQTINMAVINRWFRKKKPNARKRILRKNRPLKYYREDAKNAVKYSQQWLQDPMKVVDLVIRGVGYFNGVNRPEISGWLFEECLTQLDLSLEDRGLCLHDLAVQKLNIGKYRSYKINLLKALDVWKELESDYDIAVTYAFLAHSYYLEKDLEKTRQMKENSITLLEQSQASDYQLSWAYIHHADCAQWTNDKQWHLDSLNKGIEFTKSHEKPEFYIYYKIRTVAVEEGTNPLEMEGIAPFIRPTKQKWRRIGATYHPNFPDENTFPV